MPGHERWKEKAGVRHRFAEEDYFSANEGFGHFTPAGDIEDDKHGRALIALMSPCAMMNICEVVAEYADGGTRVTAARYHKNREGIYNDDI